MEERLRRLGFIGCPRYDNNPVSWSGMRFMHYDLGTWYLIRKRPESKYKLVPKYRYLKKYWTLIATMVSNEKSVAWDSQKKKKKKKKKKKERRKEEEEEENERIFFFLKDATSGAFLD
jgi:hypothetical protein